MFSNLLRLGRRRSLGQYDRGFLQEAKKAPKSPRNLRVERILEAGWAVIALKSVAVLWLFSHYHVQVNPFWVIGPTIAFGALCTLVYILRD